MTSRLITNFAHNGVQDGHAGSTNSSSSITLVIFAALVLIAIGMAVYGFYRRAQAAKNNTHRS